MFDGEISSSRPLFEYSICILVCFRKKYTHTLNIDILYSNKGLDDEISPSNMPPHNYKNNLKFVE